MFACKQLKQKTKRKGIDGDKVQLKNQYLTTKLNFR